MKIAFIGQKGIPTKSGGVERHVESLATRLSRSGHDVTVYGRKSYGISKKDMYKGVCVLGMPSIATKNLDAITATLFATFHALTKPYDIIHYQSIGPASLAWIIRICKPKTRLITTFHCKDYEHQKWGIFARAYFHIGEWVTHRVPHKTITVSKGLKKYSKETYGVSTEYIPNGCAVEEVKTQEALKKWNLREGEYILSVSRLVRHKGIHFLIEAYDTLSQSGKIPKNMKLVIVGDSSASDAYVSELQRQSWGRKNIIFTGEQQGKSLEELFSHAYLFCQPSLSEGLSIALLESLGYGLCPLVSDISENKEAIGTTGYTFASGDAEDLARKLSICIENPRAVSAIGKLAQKRVREVYNWDAIAERTEKLYEVEIEKNALAYPQKQKVRKV